MASRVSQAVLLLCVVSVLAARPSTDRVERLDDQPLELGELSSVTATQQHDAPEEPPLEFWNPPNITEGDVADNGTITGAYNYSTVSAKIYTTSELLIDNETLAEMETKVAARFGHPMLITKEIYNFSVVTPCGNGIRDASEECDDGNIKEGDGCSANCTVEGGWACKSKTELQNAGTCHRCAADECTVFYNNAWHCLKTKAKFSNKNQPDSVYQRAANGFCECHESRCFLGDLCMKPTGGWYKEINGTCSCGPGHCLMPTAQGADAGAEANACFKMNSNYKRHPATGLCECADAQAAVSSTDPAEARLGQAAACKTIPSKPIRKSTVPGKPDVYAAFACHSNPYNTSRDDMLCDECAAGSCKLPRELKSSNGVAPAAQPGKFTCIDADKQAAIGYKTSADGTCVCDDQTSCLVPEGDSFQCKHLDNAFPYGSTITSEGRCGCRDDATSCIMATSKASDGSVDDFVCLDLGTSVNRTEYGEKFVRGSSGYCQCADTHCKTERQSGSLGDFDCIDTVNDKNYYKDKDSGMCQCQSPCQFKTETPGIEQCASCPTLPGTCVSKCNTNHTANNLTSTTCTKYCATKTVKLSVPPGRSKVEMLSKKDMLARVLECFVTKVVKCVKDEVQTPIAGWACEQTVKAQLLYNCPGRWSQHAPRILPDGTETMGFTSVCDAHDLECQLQMCDRDTTHSGVCIEKLVSA